jgi:hypothetical protein
VLVAALIAVARVVTPTVVPIVPTALTHQNTAIALAAIVLANSFGRDRTRSVIAYPSFDVGLGNAQGINLNTTEPILFHPKRRN